MAKLDYEIFEPLTLSEDAWQDDVAVIVVTGTSYGGAWVMNAKSAYLPPGQAQSIGEIETDEAPSRPDLALNAASNWVQQYCHANGFHLHQEMSLNHHYGPDEAPFFSGGSFVIGRRQVKEGS